MKLLILSIFLTMRSLCSIAQTNESVAQKTNSVDLGKSRAEFSGEVVTITNLTGRIYKNVNITQVDPDGIIYVFADTNACGGGKILFENLNSYWRSHFFYSGDDETSFKQYKAAFDERMHEAYIASPPSPQETYNSWFNSTEKKAVEIGSLDKLANSYYQQGLDKYSNGDKDGGISDINKSTQLLNVEMSKWPTFTQALTNPPPIR